MGYLHRNFSGFLCAVSAYVTFACIIAKDYSAVPYCTIENWFVHSFILFLLVNGVNLSFNLEYSAKNVCNPGHQNLSTPLINWNPGLTSNCYKLFQFFCDSKYCFCICTQNFQFHKCSLVSWKCEKEKAQFENQT